MVKQVEELKGQPELTCFPVRDFCHLLRREVGIPVAGPAELIAQSTDKIRLRRGRHELGGGKAGGRARRCAFSATGDRATEELREHHAAKTLGRQQTIQASIHHRIRKTAADENRAGNLPAVYERRPAMSEQRATNGQFPNVARAEVMTDVVVGGPVILPGVERIYGGGYRRSGEKDVRVSAVRYVVEGVAVGVVGLKYAFVPAAVDVVFEGKRHAFVVRYSVGVKKADLAEPRVERSSRKPDERGNVRTGPKPRTAKCIYAVAIHQVMNAVIPVVSDVERAVLANRLLNFQAPFLELSDPGLFIGAEQARRRKERNVCLDLSQRLVVFEAVDQADVVGGRLREQIATVQSFTRSDVTSTDEESIDPGGVRSKIIREHGGEGIVEESDASADYRAAQGVGRPRKTEPRLPENRTQTLQLLVQSLQDIGAEGRVDVIVRHQKWSVQTVKAIGLADGIGLVLNSQRESEREVRFYLPVVFAVKSQGIKSDRLRQRCGEALLENRTRAGCRVDTTIKERGNRIGCYEAAREYAEVFIAHIVTAEFGAEFESVIAQRF